MMGSDPGQKPEENRAGRSIYIAIAMGVAAPTSVPVVQWVARRLPVVPLPNYPAVYLSVAVAFALAGAALYFGAVSLRRIEERPEEPLFPTSVVFLGLVTLMAGFVFASISDFLRPRSVIARIVPALAVLGGGFGAYLALSSRGRRALTSELSRRVGSEVLRYVELASVTWLVLVPLLPNDYRFVIAYLHSLGLSAPFPITLAFLLNRRVERYDALRCRLTSYAAGAPFVVGTFFLMPAL